MYWKIGKVVVEVVFIIGMGFISSEHFVNTSRLSLGASATL